MNAKPLNQIKAEPKEQTARLFLADFPDLCWAYGKQGDWGLPLGKISLWAGAAGVGKTRLLTQIMKSLADKQGERSLIAQGEVSASQMKTEKFQNLDSDKIYVTTEMNLDSICESLRQIKPKILFVDSVTMLARRENEVQEVIDKLREVTEETATHVVLISQQNAEGKPKGGTTLPHMVDVVCEISPYMPDLTDGGIFYLQVTKNRYGKSGKWTVYEHKDWGVNEGYNFREEDPDWFKAPDVDKMLENDPLADEQDKIGSSQESKASIENPVYAEVDTGEVLEFRSYFEVIWVGLVAGWQNKTERLVLKERRDKGK